MDREEWTAMGLDEAVVEKIVQNEEAIRGEYESRIQKSAVEQMVRESGAKSVRAVEALLEDTEGDDFKESIASQLEKLKNDSATSFLFEKKGGYQPGVAAQKLPDTASDKYQTALEAARARGDKVGSIRIKQQAARNGIILY